MFTRFGKQIFKWVLWFLAGAVLSLLGVSLPATSRANVERTVPWEEMDVLNAAELSSSHLNSAENLYQSSIPVASVVQILSDPDHRVSAEFKIPPEMKTDVAFWLRIYTQYSSQEVVLFDSNHLGLVYEVLDLKRFSETAKSQSEWNDLSSQSIEDATDRYKSALVHLAENPDSSSQTPFESALLRKIKKAGLQAQVAELVQSFRSIHGQRDRVIEGLETAEVFLPQMEQIFKRMGIPIELTRLSLIESAFDVKARSKAGAMGVWQFMPTSGRQYLWINEAKKIDERLSPLKSTLAAGKLLKWNFEHLGSWILAIISYNHGLRNLPKVQPGNTQFEDLAYLFETSTSGRGTANGALGWASRNYYLEFLAMLYVEAYRQELYGISPEGGLTPVDFRQLKEAKTGLSIALDYGIPLGEFQLYNADVKDLHQPLPKGFWIAVPGQIGDISDFVESALRHS
jgi:membrane-bound lytic murein transglycosylase D